VRALTAYQVADGLFPEILYEGTDGFGPLVTTGAIGGHIWVSDPQDPTSWSDQTGSINPGHFPVPAIAIDPFDVQTDPTAGTAGQAAYIALTGYGTGNHVWKTVNGGLTWLAFNGFAPNDLPDVPANALVVDSNAQGGSVYVGTDQGVYVTSTNDPNTTSWLPVGGGVGGKLPNVPVTALQCRNVRAWSVAVCAGEYSGFSGFDSFAFADCACGTDCALRRKSERAQFVRECGFIELCGDWKSAAVRFDSGARGFGQTLRRSM
jgi:hypothetical protein